MLATIIEQTKAKARTKAGTPTAAANGYDKLVGDLKDAMTNSVSLTKTADELSRCAKTFVTRVLHVLKADKHDTRAPRADGQAQRQDGV